MFGEAPFAVEPFSTLPAGGTPTIVAVTGVSLTLSIGCYQYYAWAEVPDAAATWIQIAGPSSSWSNITTPTNTWGEPTC